ncbi:MAG TPA: flagellar hook-length control protein FliK [bacterium]|nr:flagellar hook-length control protein FliK [bacterium]HPN43173.1 flagellar hook-length control protein FliK [bacterium]
MKNILGIDKLVGKIRNAGILNIFNSSNKAAMKAEPASAFKTILDSNKEKYQQVKSVGKTINDRSSGVQNQTSTTNSGVSLQQLLTEPARIQNNDSALTVPGNHVNTVIQPDNLTPNKSGTKVFNQPANITNMSHPEVKVQSSHTNPVVTERSETTFTFSDKHSGNSQKSDAVAVQTAPGDDFTKPVGKLKKLISFFLHGRTESNVETGKAAQVKRNDTIPAAKNNVQSSVPSGGVSQPVKMNMTNPQLLSVTKPDDNYALDAVVSYQSFVNTNGENDIVINENSVTLDGKTNSIPDQFLELKTISVTKSLARKTTGASEPQPEFISALYGQILGQEPVTITRNTGKTTPPEFNGNDGKTEPINVSTGAVTDKKVTIPQKQTIPINTANKAITFAETSNGKKEKTGIAQSFVQPKTAPLATEKQVNFANAANFSAVTDAASATGEKQFNRTDGKPLQTQETRNSRSRATRQEIQISELNVKTNSGIGSNPVTEKIPVGGSEKLTTPGNSSLTNPEHTVSDAINSSGDTFSSNTQPEPELILNSVSGPAFDIGKNIKAANPAAELTHMAGKVENKGIVNVLSNTVTQSVNDRQNEPVNTRTKNIRQNNGEKPVLPQAEKSTADSLNVPVKNVKVKNNAPTARNLPSDVDNRILSKTAKQSVKTPAGSVNEVLNENSRHTSKNEGSVINAVKRVAESINSNTVNNAQQLTGSTSSKLSNTIQNNSDAQVYSSSPAKQHITGTTSIKTSNYVQTTTDATNNNIAKSHSNISDNSVRQTTPLETGSTIKVQKQAAAFTNTKISSQVNAKVTVTDQVTNNGKIISEPVHEAWKNVVVNYESAPLSGSEKPTQGEKPLEKTSRLADNTATGIKTGSTILHTGQQKAISDISEMKQVDHNISIQPAVKVTAADNGKNTILSPLESPKTNSAADTILPAAQDEITSSEPVVFKSSVHVDQVAARPLLNDNRPSALLPEVIVTKPDTVAKNKNFGAKPVNSVIEQEVTRIKADVQAAALTNRNTRPVDKTVQAIMNIAGKKSNKMIDDLIYGTKNALGKIKESSVIPQKSAPVVTDRPTELNESIISETKNVNTIPGLNSKMIINGTQKLNSIQGPDDLNEETTKVTPIKSENNIIQTNKPVQITEKTEIKISLQHDKSEPLVTIAPTGQRSEQVKRDDDKFLQNLVADKNPGTAVKSNKQKIQNQEVTKNASQSSQINVQIHSANAENKAANVESQVTDFVLPAADEFVRNHAKITAPGNKSQDLPGFNGKTQVTKPEVFNRSADIPPVVTPVETEIRYKNQSISTTNLEASHSGINENSAILDKNGNNRNNNEADTGLLKNTGYNKPGDEAKIQKSESTSFIRQFEQTITGGITTQQTPMTPIKPAELALVTNRIQEGLLTLASQGKNEKLVLHTEISDLGSLRIELTNQDDRIQVILRVQSDTARQALEQNLPDLKATLAKQDVSANHIQIVVSENQGRETGNRERMFSRNRKESRKEESVTGATLSTSQVQGSVKYKSQWSTYETIG